MMLLFHIFTALTSMAYSTYVFFRPSKARLYTGYGLVVLTLASGTYLVVQTRTRLLPACASGLIYVGCVSVGLVAAQYKLARVRTK